jgi:hypothetical protein
LDESPIVAGVTVTLLSIFNRARSSCFEAPTRLAFRGFLASFRVTVIDLAPLTTWSLVTIRPSRLMTTPVPDEVTVVDP